MTRAREAAELVVYLREETAFEPADVMASVRNEFPGVTMIAVFREVSAIESARGNA